MCQFDRQLKSTKVQHYFKYNLFSFPNTIVNFLFIFNLILWLPESFRKIDLSLITKTL